MQFFDIVGQQNVKKKLLSAIGLNKLGHALLFTGKKGVGKLSLAIALSQYMSCKNPTIADSCGKCSSCKKFNKLIHPDLHFSFPIMKKSNSSKDISDNFLAEWRNFVLNNPYDDINIWYEKIGIENKQSGIYVDESEEIIKKMNLKPYEAPYKTFIIWFPEKMNVSAANKLLKVIEEPFEKTIIILITLEAEKLLPTILSRTQRIHIPSITKEDLKKYLQKNNISNPEDYDNLIHQANGSLSEIFKLLGNNEMQNSHYNEFVKMMRIFYKKNIQEISAWSEEVSRFGREYQKVFISFALSMFRACFMQKYHSPKLIYLSQNELQFVTKIAPFIQEKNMERIYTELSKAIKDITANGNAKIIFFDLALKTSQLISTKPQ